MDGSRRGRVAAFLSSSLKATTQAMYQRELEYFSNEMVSRGVDWSALSEEDLDWTIADFLVERYESTYSSQGLASAASLVAAIVKRNPRIIDSVMEVFRFVEAKTPSSASASYAQTVA